MFILCFFRCFGRDNVAYINQDLASNGKFEFKMRDSLKPGDNEEKEYNVLVGGTGVAIAKTVTFKLGTSATKTTYSISGTVGDVMNFGDGEFAADTEAYAASIDVCDENYDLIENISIDVSSIDPEEGIGSVPFTVSGLEIGKQYYLYFMRAGACDKEISLASTITDDINDVEVELWAGDPSDDGIIDSMDISMVVATSKNDYDIECDANADVSVDSMDISIFVANANNYDSYNLSFE